MIDLDLFYYGASSKIHVGTIIGWYETDDGRTGPLVRTYCGLRGYGDFAGSGGDICKSCSRFAKRDGIKIGDLGYLNQS